MSCNLCSDCPFVVSSNQKIYYEAHVTVKAEHAGFAERFELACDIAKTKGLCIENFHLKSNSYQTEWITCSKYQHQSEADFFSVLDSVSDVFLSHGFLILRQKIETVPWNVLPAENGYFETHIDVDVESMDFLKHSGFMLSRNVGSDKSILTFRRHMNDYQKYLLELNSKVEELSNKIHVKKQITEYACYDSNVLLDKEWIDSYQV